MKTAVAIKTDQFARRGQEWFLQREEAAESIYAEDRLKGGGGMLRIHDENGCMMEEQPMWTRMLTA